MNIEKLEQLTRQILEEIGEKVDRKGIQETPKRVAKMYSELFRGYTEEEPPITTFPNGEDGIVTTQLITDKGDFYSQCEHHMVPFFGEYFFAYMPNEKGAILGLSKVARIVDYYSARLQIQERLVKNIVDALWTALCKEGTPPRAMGLVMRGEHLCKTMRGAKKKGHMTTCELRGELRDNHSMKAEFFTLAGV